MYSGDFIVTNRKLWKHEQKIVKIIFSKPLSLIQSFLTISIQIKHTINKLNTYIVEKPKNYFFIMF